MDKGSVRNMTLCDIYEEEEEEEYCDGRSWLYLGGGVKGAGLGGWGFWGKGGMQITTKELT